MESKKKWDLVALASIPLVMTLGNSMLIPVLPSIEKELHISAFRVSMIITVYSVVAILLIPIAGYLSDRIGRKKVIIPSLVIAGIGGLVTGWASWQLAHPYYIILVGRLLQGIGSAGAAPVVMPLVGDMFKDEKEVSAGLGLIETSNTFGKVMSPIIGAALATWIWHLPFWFIPIFCAISIVLVGFLVKSPQKESKEPPPFKTFISNFKKTFKNNTRWLLAIFFIGGIVMFVLFGVLFYLSTTLEERYHINGIKKGLVLAVPLVALSLSSYIAGKKIGQNKQVMKWLIFSGILLLAISLVSVTFTEGLYFLLGILFISGVGLGAALPCLDALITEGIEKEERGTITSLYSSMRFVGVALGPPIYAIIMKGDHAMVFYTSSGISIVAACLAFFAIKPEKSEKSDTTKKAFKPAVH
ncbi:major facilitator family transporter [Fictibacillus macauensis ZFHKF-1]|uniref:Major facilitator family transporter n=1 Tax=Fictibacillus macauensis ZFHKF-1 TaxID=1196324 RepID=I8J4W9_9BACL|nr:major facilitator family transporter [Fictibacillus macauensis ZFHKF-1]